MEVPYLPILLTADLRTVSTVAMSALSLALNAVKRSPSLATIYVTNSEMLKITKLS